MLLSDGPDRKTAIGHYASKAFVPWAVLVVALSVAEYWIPVLEFVAWLWTPVNIAIVYAQLRWHRGLCEHCVGDMPLNGPELAEKYRRERSIVHLCDRWQIGPLWLLAAWIPLLWLPLLLVPKPWTLPVVFVASVPVVVVMVRHYRVRVWCRQCGWGEGGPEESVPVPPPVPTGKVNA